MSPQFSRAHWQAFSTAAMICALAIARAPIRALSVGPTVSVHVVANDSNSTPQNPLTFRWRATDGQINDVNASTTTWTIPSGPGVHFAYVLVSNGKGGYTERRIIVNTDATNTPIPPTTARALSPRPPQEIPGFPIPFREWLGGGVSRYSLGGPAPTPTITRTFKVALPDVAVRGRVEDPPVLDTTSTSLTGDFTFQRLSPGDDTPQKLSVATCNLPDGSPRIQECFGKDDDEVIDVEANQTNRINLIPAPASTNWITGRVLLADSITPCGTENQFFGVNSSATAELVDANLHTDTGHGGPR